VDSLPLKLSDATGVPYYRQIVDQVAQLIRAGQLEPGRQLPSVREMAGHLLVSLITTRRAYADLETAGLIVRRQGHGTYVAEEIEMASREQAVSETREHLSSAVGHARRLGLDTADVREIFDDVLAQEGDSHVER
jgi:GntR family transcriptional regulator